MTLRSREIYGCPGSQTGKLGNLAGKSIYGTDRVGAAITGGVDLVSDNKGDLSGPRASARGYSYGSPSGSAATVAALYLTGAAIFPSMTDKDRKRIGYDPDLLALDDGTGTATHAYTVISISASALDQLDQENLSAVTGTLALSVMTLEAGKGVTRWCSDGSSSDPSDG